MILRSGRAGLELPDQLDALRTAVELAEGRLDPDHVAFARNVIARADGRLRHGTTHTLVALLGSTGAGKSSLTNALTATEVAKTGLRRPTTSTTLACVWGDGDEVAASTPLLDWLEVPNRHHVDRRAGGHDLSGLILLDVPDHDSVEVSHRLEMERIAEHADLLLWVTDPEKYADASLHHYLKFLAGHDAVTTVLLNKADVLPAAELEKCRRDLVRLVADDGMRSPNVLAVSAADGTGIDELSAMLASTVAEQRAAVDRLRADVVVAAGELAGDTGDAHSGSIKKRDIETLTESLIDATGIEAVTHAVAAGSRRDAVDVMGWPFTRWVRRLRPHPLRRLHLGESSAGRSSLPSPSTAQLLRAEGAIRGFADTISADLEEPWPTLVRTAGTPDPDVLRDQLDVAVAEGVRQHQRRRPRWWTAVGVLQKLFAVLAVAGLLWLAVLFVLLWFRIPEPPTPEWRSLPVPTLLLAGGVAAGLLLAFVARRFARSSARRAARRARREASENVRTLTDRLVVQPIRDELEQRDELVQLLERAGHG